MIKKKNTEQPILTIGIIFKNESRCLKRCLDSLTALRQAVSCELIMADTGSNDGSRQIAEQYADILFDFPWTDDFAAARNAVMDKAAGRWYLTIDADEFLDTDISELSGFLHNKKEQEMEACILIQRNYDTMDMCGDYSDFRAMRMLRMSTGLRYSGTIHEAWPFPPGTHDVQFLTKTILHHDGYADPDREEGKAKCERNLALLRQRLKNDPDNLTYVLQYMESSTKNDDYMDALYHAVDLVQKKCTRWDELGPSIFRHAVTAAKMRNLPELEKWIERSMEWFPESFFTRIDVEFTAFIHSWGQGKYADCILQGERYLKAMEDCRLGRGEIAGLLYGICDMSSPGHEQSLKIYLADAYIKESNPKRSEELLETLDCCFLEPDTIENLMRVFWKLHMGGTDTSKALIHFFEESQKLLPDERSASKRMRAFFRTALKIFMYREDEGNETTPTAPGSTPHTLFLPLKKRCELGIAAMIIEEKDTKQIQQLLSIIQRWDRFPIEALAHAIKCGVPFPQPGKPLKSEEMDDLTIRLAAEKGMLPFLLRQIKDKDFSDNTTWQTLAWNRKIVHMAVRTYNWKRADTPGASSLDNIGGKAGLAMLYAQMENAVLPRYYAPELLCEENLFMLPAFDRFGWHYIQAFCALDAGNPAGYVQELKAGIHTCTELTPLVEYLVRHIPKLHEKQNNPSPELAALAEQVKNLLSAYPADDPAVKAIKASPAYQKVAWIIEK